MIVPARRAADAARRRTAVCTAATATVAFCLAAPAMGQTTQPIKWTRPPITAGPGAFVDGANWDLGVAPSLAAFNDAEIGNDGTATIAAGDAAESGYLVLGRRPGESGTLTMTGGTLTLGELRVGGKEYIYNDATGVRDPNGGGTGVINHSGGVVNVNSLAASTPGDPTAVPPIPASGPNQSVYIGDGGLAAGGNTANGTYNISGDARLNAGVATNDSLVVGTGKGTLAAVNQSGTSSVNSTGFVTIGRAGANAVYTLTGGSLTAATEVNVGDGIGNNGADSLGAVVQSGASSVSGGVIIVGRRGGTGTYDLAGGTVSSSGDINVGGIAGSTGGNGSFTQSGGSTVSAGNNIWIGGTAGGTGSYTLHDGTLGAGSMLAIGDGAGATATFAQDHAASNVTAFNLSVGRSGATGSYTISAGKLTTNNDLWAGGGNNMTSGTGTFTQSGTAEVEVKGNLNVGLGSTGTVSGTYNMNGGSLLLSKTGAIFAVGNGAGNTGTFNHTAGTVKLPNGSTLVDIGRTGATGTYLLSGSGELSAFKLSFNNLSTVNKLFEMTGGKLTLTGGVDFISGLGAPRRLHLAGGDATIGTIAFNANVGDNSSVDISGSGVNKVTAVNLAKSLLNVSGGTNTITTLNINGAGTATFTGGSTALTNLTLTNGSAVNISGGTVTATGNITLGGTSKLQTSTDVNLAGTVIIGTPTVQVDANTLTFSGPVTTGAARTLTKTGAGTLTITGAHSHVAGSALTAAAGTLNLNSDGGANLTIHANGGTTNFGVTQHLAAVNVNDGGHAVVTSGAGGNKVLVATGLAVAGSGTLDLRDNKLITATPAGTATGGVYAAGSVHRMVQTAYQESAWSGPGLTTSMDDAKTGLTTVAIATGEQIGVTTFGGQTVAPTDTIAFYTYGGDTNFDGKLDADDYGTIDFNVLLPGPIDGYYNGDFNYDGVVNADDYGVIDFNILAQTTPFPTGGSAAGGATLSGVTAVPEPTTAGIVLAAWGVSLLHRGSARRRRRA